MFLDDRLTGYRLNPVELVAFHLLKWGGHRYPEPSAGVVKALWKLDRMKVMMMGGCPQFLHDIMAHEPALFAGNPVCRMEGSERWHIFKLVDRSSVQYPVLCYTISSEDGGFRHISMDDVYWIARLMRKSGHAQVNDVVRRKIDLRRKARVARHEQLQEIMDPHIDGMRREAQQFNLSSTPTDKPGKSRTITNLYRNERTAAE